MLPERLGSEYVAEDGARKVPVMLHRAIFGSFERMIGILIENYAGRFPLWLAPTQAVVATIVNDADGYANEVADKLRAAGMRVATDLRNEKINLKVREHSLAHVPLILAVGRRDMDNKTVAIRRLGSEKQDVLELGAAVTTLSKEAAPPF
jgi:threonyl-tRNA synthetase